jgi:PAS domain S-box-containing protein
VRILVTGASSGFGALIVRSLVAAGHRVVAGMRDPEGRNAAAVATLHAWCEDRGCRERVEVVRLDVTSQADVDALIGTFDVVVLNAGVAAAGLTETFSADVATRIFAVNVVGSQRVLRSVLPGMRARRRGLVVFMGSALGREVTPCLGLYTASKHAIEGLAESYRYELAPLGIDVCVVQPGTFPTTSILANLLPADDPSRADSYGPVLTVPGAVFGAIQQMVEAGISPDPQLVADAVLDLVGGPRPARVIVDPNGTGGAARINAVARSVQAEVLAGMGLDWLDPETSRTRRGHPVETIMHAILAETPLVIYAKDVEGRFVLSNRRHAELLDLPSGAILGRTDTDLLGEDAAAIEDVTRGVLTSGVPDASEYELMLGGEQRIFLETIFPLRDRDGALLGVGGIASDITARRHLEDEVRRKSIDVRVAHDRLQAMIDAIPDLMFTVDEHGSLSCVKLEATDDLAVSPEEAEGMSIFDILPRAAADEFVVAMRRAIAGDGPQTVRYRLAVKSGPAEFEARIARQATDRVTVIVRNITAQVTARRLIEEHRERLLRLATQQNNTEEVLRTRIAAEVHDGVAQEVAMARILITKAAADAPALTDMLGLAADILDGAVKHINELIVEISPPALRTLGLVPALRDAAERIAARHGLAIDFDAPLVAPTLTKDETTALYWSTRELMTNVAKHARATRMVVQFVADPAYVAVTVRDDGCGISAESPPTSGGGFGIFGARERLRLLGGDLEVMSLDVGTLGKAFLRTHRS